MHIAFCRRWFRATFVSLIACATAHAQWTGIALHASGASRDEVLGGNGGQEVGSATFGPRMHASLWSGSSGTWVNLDPSNTSDSRAWTAFGGRQGGIGSSGHASLWSGTPQSRVDLHPAQAGASSIVYGMDATQQVGNATIADLPHASLWAGTAASWVDLNPAGASQSVAYATDGGKQVGYAVGGWGQHAGFWTGSAASWVDLNPAGADYSTAYAADAGQQGGSATIGGTEHAGLWNGSAGSWVDMNPTGSTFSTVKGMAAGVQVGQARPPGSLVMHAMLWHGTAASCEDLMPYLPGPAAWDDSRANAVWIEGNTLYVSGWGYNGNTSRDEGFLLSRPIPAPGAGLAFALLRVLYARRRSR